MLERVGAARDSQDDVGQELLGWRFFDEFTIILDVIAHSIQVLSL